MNHRHATAVAVGLMVLAAAVPASAHSVRTVQPGETLWSIALASGSTTHALAAANGLSEDSHVTAGQTIQLPAAAEQAGAPQPTQERVDPSLVQQVALEHAVPPSLAAAIAEQESGFSNMLISGANARGVMQILPGTWEFVQSNLAEYPLDPASARENVHAGVLYLGQLLRETGGDQVSASAAYYQGLSSVRNVGLLPETRAYVDSVTALSRKYGG